jgi:histidinol-phosphatase (PHP family)
MHTEFSADSDAPVRAQVDQAAALGMTEICITDHHDYDAVSDGLEFLLDFDQYLPYMEKIRQEYDGKIRVNCGVELGLQNHIKEYLDELVRKYSFDYIIGSSHFIDTIDPYLPVYFEGRSERAAYERFFEISLSRVRNLDCFDSYGHLDYVVRYGPNRNRDYSYREYQDYIDPILKTLIEKGKGLECNTGGLKYGLGHPNPTEEILRRYRELGGEILTIGSDAHAPQHIGYDFSLIPDMLKACGFRYYTIFRERRPVFLPL